VARANWGCIWEAVGVIFTLRELVSGFFAGYGGGWSSFGLSPRCLWKFATRLKLAMHWRTVLERRGFAKNGKRLSRKQLEETNEELHGEVRRGDE